MAGINPFRPNYPVVPGMFVGRINELQKLENHLVQTRAGIPSNFMITGERGIGKSSLLLYLKALAKGDISFSDKKFKFLVISLDIEKSTTQLGLIKRIEFLLNQELGKTEPARQFLKDAWDFAKKVEAAGFRLGQVDQVEGNELLQEQFANSLGQTVQRIVQPDSGSIFSSKYDGIILLIDEADNASKDLNLGSFLKLLLERLQRSRVNNLLVGLAGLDELKTVLTESHPSSMRLFEHLHLERLGDDEVESVISIAMEEASTKNDKKYEVKGDAKKSLISISEGYPHFIQQYGYSAFEADSDDIIDQDDVIEGIFGEHGGMEAIGDRYYRNDFYNKIQKDSYRQVLRIMASKLDAWISKKEIRTEFVGKDSTLDNALQALRERGIIISKEGERGVYRLQHKGFAYWIRIFTSNPDELQQTLDTHAAAKSKKETENTTSGQSE